MAVTNYNIGVAYENIGDSVKAEVYIKKALKTLEGLGELGTEIYLNIKESRSKVHEKVNNPHPNLAPSSKPVSKRFTKSPYLSKKSPSTKKYVSATGILSEVWDLEDAHWEADVSKYAHIT